MSYNISTWNIRSIHLELPIDFDFRAWLRQQPEQNEQGYEKKGRRWCLEDENNTIQCDLAAGTWKLSAINSFLSGNIQGQTLILSDAQAMEWQADFSGCLYEDVLLPLFQAFKGNLDAIVVWESGDTVRHLSIVQGVISEKDVA